MPEESYPASQALKRAYSALREGDKQAARRWAQLAAALAPGMEDPWLLMAAVATPRASIVYFEKALAINPGSSRALKGLQWAHARQPWEQPQSLPVIAGSFPRRPPVRIRTEIAIPVRPARRVRPARDKRLWGLLLISPWLVGLIMFKLAPLLATLGISFTDFFLLTPETMGFVGLKNYLDLFKDPNLWSAFMGTFKLALIVIPLQTAGAILLASLLNDEKLRLKDTLRVLFFLPSIIPSAASIFMWQGFTNARSGWLNALLLNPLGLSKYIHFTNRGDTPSLLILATLWSIGPGFMIILGAMQGIPLELFEVALVDGASRLRRFFSITLPLVTPAIFFTLILNLTAVFGGAILLDRGYGFNSNLSSVDNYLYFLLFNTFRLGSAASLAWIFFIFLVVVILVLFASSRRWVYFPDQEN